MTACPNSAATGCRCVEHAPGLLAYAPSPAAYEAALERVRPVRLRIVTPGPALLNAEPPCTGTPVCACRDCQADRARLIQRGPQGEGNASPFKRRQAA